MQWGAHSSIFAILSCESFATVTLHAERELTADDIERMDRKRLVGRSWRSGHGTAAAPHLPRVIRSAYAIFCVLSWTPGWMQS